MPGTRIPMVTFSISSKSAPKRKSPDSNGGVDTNGQVERLKRQKNEDENNNIDLTPSHQIPDVLDLAAVSLVAAEPTGEPQTSGLQAPVQDTNSQSMYSSTGVQASQASNPQQSLPAGSPALTRYSNQLTLTPESQSSNSHTAADQGPSIWAPGEWDQDVFDTDSMGMSLALMRRLVNEVSLLKSSLDDYKKFNIHLGGKQKKKRFPDLIPSTTL